MAIVLGSSLDNGLVNCTREDCAGFA